MRRVEVASFGRKTASIGIAARCAGLGLLALFSASFSKGAEQQPRWVHVEVPQHCKDPVGSEDDGDHGR